MTQPYPPSGGGNRTSSGSLDSWNVVSKGLISNLKKRHLLDLSACDHSSSLVRTRRPFMLLGQEDYLTQTEPDPSIYRESWQQIPSCNRGCTYRSFIRSMSSFDEKWRIASNTQDYGKEVESRYDHAMVTNRKLAKSVLAYIPCIPR